MPHDHQSPAPPRLVYPLKEALELLSISRTTFYDLKNTGRIRPRKLGTRTVLTLEEINRFIDTLEG